MSSIENLEALQSALPDVKEENILDTINKNIDTYCCLDIVKQLSDKSLLDEYKKQKSVKKRIFILQKILEDESIENTKVESILEKSIDLLVPPGTKGVIKGNKFNKIIQETILSLNLSKDIYDIQFEKNHTKFNSSEIPDWYIYHKKLDKIMIGMNQLDLWSGGQQINRGSKYVLDDTKQTKQIKIVSVVCNHITITSEKNKVFILFQKGIETKRLCYPKELQYIIEDFFEDND